VPPRLRMRLEGWTTSEKETVEYNRATMNYSWTAIRHVMTVGRVAPSNTALRFGLKLKLSST
jgi:hypothetical protein